MSSKSCATPIAVLLLCVEMTLAVSHCPNIKVYWWESRPYVYQEQAKASGVLPEILLEAAKYCCTAALNLDWSSKIASYENAWLALTQSVPKEANGSTIDIWLPFSSVPPTSGNMTALKIVESNQLILFVSENKWDKLEVVFEGFKRIAPQLLATLLLTILFGIFIWIAETCKNSQFPGPFPRGAWHGFWWAAVTITTVGYGDKVPRTGLGRIIGVTWMITGLIIFPVLTAEVTSILTDTSYSLVTKKAGALKNSNEMKQAIDHGANAYECSSYRHCLDMLQNQVIEVMIVDVHVASWLQNAEEHGMNLQKKGQLAAKIPINAFMRKADESKLKDLFSCISTNSSLVTKSLRKAFANFQLSDSKGAIFSEGMKQFSYVLAGVVVGIYFVVFAIDRCIQYKKRSKIGDFRQGVFMGNVTIKDGSKHEMKEIDDHKQMMLDILQRQRLQLAEMQQSLDELERRISS